MLRGFGKVGFGNVAHHIGVNINIESGHIIIGNAGAKEQNDGDDSSDLFCKNKVKQHKQRNKYKKDERKSKQSAFKIRDVKVLKNIAPERKIEHAGEIYGYNQNQFW